MAKKSWTVIKAIHPTIWTTNTICKLNFLPNAPINGAAKNTRTDAAKFTSDPDNDIEKEKNRNFKENS